MIVGFIMFTVALALLGVTLSGYRLVPVRRDLAVIYLVPLQAFADSTTNYFSGALSTGSLRAAIGVAVLFAIGGRIRITPVNAAVLVILVHGALGAAMSSDPAYALGWWFKLAIPFLGLAILASEPFRRDTFRHLAISITLAAGITLGQLALAQALLLGESYYLEDSIYWGGALVQSAYVLAVMVLVAPALLEVFRKGWARLVVIALTLGSLIFTLVSLRRGTIAALGVGIAMYALFSPRRGRSVKAIGLAAAALVALSPLYMDVLVERYEARQYKFNNMQNQIDREGRYLETMILLEDYSRRSPIEQLIGRETLNSANTDFMRQRMGGRNLHVDYNVVLHGFGVVGLITYLFLLGAIGVALFRGRLRSMLEGEIRAVGFALLACVVVVGVSQGIFVQSFRMATMVFLGTAFSYIRSVRRSHAQAHTMPPAAIASISTARA